MLRSGHIVALSTKAELLQGGSSNVLQFKTDALLPADLAAQARITGRIVQLPAASAADVERILALLRSVGVPVEDLEIRRADLEDVFLQVMSRDAAAPHATAQLGQGVAR
ncbi:hypothetical protein D3C71_1628700 [compost metagenome]